MQNNSNASTSEITAVVNDLQTAMNTLVNHANCNKAFQPPASPTAEAKQNDQVIQLTAGMPYKQQLPRRKLSLQIRIFTK